MTILIKKLFYITRTPYLGLMSIVCATGVWGQDAGNPAQGANNDSIEEVFVIGSHIRTTFDNRTPIDILDRAALEKSSTSQLQDVLKDVPANTGSLFTDESGLSAGTGQFNIRGLGLGSTLTLVNSRRGGVAPVADPSGGDFLDINQFPLSAIKRVELLKDGASSIYGSEAVSGVANIVTRKGFEGMEVTAGYEEANTNAYHISLAAGKVFGNASFNFYATYYHQDRANRADLDFVVDRVNGGGIDGLSRLSSSSGAPGTYFPAAFDADGNPINLPGGVGFADPDCEAAGGFFAINSDGSLNTSTCRHSFFEQQSVLPEIDRLQVFAEYELPINDSVNYYGEAGFSRNVFLEDNGPLPTVNGLVDGGRLFIPADHPFNFFIADPGDPTLLIYIDPAVFDPGIHTTVDLAASARPLGRQFNHTGIDSQDQRREFIYTRILNGLEFSLSDLWQLNTSHMFASSNFTGSIPLTYRSDIFNQLLIDGSFNPFGTSVSDPTLISPKDGVSVAGNSNTVIEKFTTVANRDIRLTQNVVDLLLTGEFSGIGTGGPIGVAFGAQYRRLELADNPDSLIAAGEARVTNISSALGGVQEVWATYAEAVLPLNDWAEIQLALRFEDYGIFGDSTDPKIAASIFVTDSLTFRGSWGTAFQAPTLRQTAEQTNDVIIDDPAIPGIGPQNAVCAPGGVTQGVTVRTQGNDEMVAQSSTSFTLGAIFQSEQSFSASLDYWNFDYEDLIAPGLDGQTILNNDCADDGIPNSPDVIRSGGGQIQEVLTSFDNVGRVKSDGVDLALSYAFLDTSLGNFTLRADFAYVNSFEVTDGSGITVDRVGSRNVTNSFNTLPQIRGVAGLDWNNGIHSANVTLRYTDGYDNDQSNDAPIDSLTTVDFQYAIDLTDGLGTAKTQLVFGAENVFDEDPPGLVRNDASGNRITAINAAFDRPGYDPRSGASLRGRLLYFRIVQGL